MQEATAKLMFESGTFSKAIVAPVPMASMGITSIWSNSAETQRLK